MGFLIVGLVTDRTSYFKTRARKAPTLASTLATTPTTASSPVKSQ
uniref:Uncharacterized protein n=1 Tax=Utricularia reniformis TaxID=192314 RepID=A0A1Y0B1M7_9LAMI|nr:hypothetical protein AEK19_MT1066 [Utricularia reniformis]ART31288.1 hypothetical protein AEK19_MT1066 [Utricularia reniformis]